MENKKKLIAVIRIHGRVKVPKDIVNTLDRLRLKRKYSCVLIPFSNKNLMGMIKKIRYYIAFGEIEKETLVKLLKARGKKIDKKIFNEEKIADSLINGNSLKKLDFKPFFKLHPPRKGIKSKLQYPKGVLGNNKKDINKLILRML